MVQSKLHPYSCSKLSFICDSTVTQNVTFQLQCGRLIGLFPYEEMNLDEGCKSRNTTKFSTKYHQIYHPISQRIGS